MKWDLTFPPGSSPEEAALLSSYLISIPFPWRGGGVRRLRVNLNKVAKPDSERFHTHPAPVIRWIQRGGYVEYEWRADGRHVRHVRRPGYIGFMPTSFCHRIDQLLDGPSYSLWIRGPMLADAYYRAIGKPDQVRTYASSRLRCSL